MTVHSQFIEQAEPVDGSARGTRSRRFYRRFGKRALDIAIVAALLPILLPFLALVIAAVSLGGSPLYSQLRVGKDGRSFRMWKIRTMVPDADAILARHLAADPALSAEWKRNQKLRCDPRITVIGAVLRKTSLDELPQIWNVLKGEMSVVGPRPFLVEQTMLYHGHAYYHLRPGMTGLWQVSERNTTSFLGRVSFDDRYAEQISLWCDLSILARTVTAVTRGTGC